MKNITKSLLLLVLFCWLPSTVCIAEVTYYHTDNLGTPMAMTDSTGKVVWQGDFYPFGEEYQVQETPNKNKRRFTGKEKDEESGLHYFGARYMDEATGRFISPDPVTAVDPQTSKTNTALLANPLRLNRYVYGLNNPHRYIDPDGNWAEAVFIEGPSIAVGTQSLISNIKQGNYGSAALDAGGIIADSAAALAPGIPGGVGLGIKASRGMTKASRNRFKRTINNLSKPDTSGLSQEKLNQLRRITNKSDAKVRVDLKGVKGSGVKPHAHVEGMGQKVESRHIWLKEGAK